MRAERGELPPSAPESAQRVARWLALVEAGSSFEAAALRVYGAAGGRPARVRGALLRDLRDVVDRL